MSKHRTWSRLRLDEVAEVISGGTPSTGVESYWGGSIPWITPTEVTRQAGQVITETKRTITAEGLGASSAHLLPLHTVLVTSRATVGAVALAGRPMATNQGFAALVARQDVLPYFLMYWVQGNRVEFERRASGSTFPEISRSKVKKIPIDLPLIEEQRRIVDFIGALDAQIEALRDERDAVDKVLTCLREDLLSPQDGWREVALGEVLVIARGGSPRPIDAYFTEDPDGVNWIKIGDVPPGGKYIDKTGQRIRSEGVSRSRSVVPGDFVLSNSMSFGRPYIVRIAGCIHDGWLSLSDEDQAFDQDFLYNLLRSRGVQAQFEALASGSAVRNLNIELVKTVRVAMPEPREQAEISAVLNMLEHMVSVLEDEHGAAKELRHSLVSALLQRGVSIPESYDALLAVAV
jgi:restriction endonuclease S subunit